MKDTPSSLSDNTTTDDLVYIPYMESIWDQAFFISLVHLHGHILHVSRGTSTTHHWFHTTDRLQKSQKLGKITHQVCSFEDDIIVNTSRLTKVRTHLRFN